MHLLNHNIDLNEPCYPTNHSSVYRLDHFDHSSGLVLPAQATSNLIYLISSYTAADDQHLTHLSDCRTIHHHKMTGFHFDYHSWMDFSSIPNTSCLDRAPSDYHNSPGHLLPLLNN